MERPGRVLLATLAVLAACALAVTQLGSASSEDLLVGRHSDTGQATAALDRTFGEDPIVIDVKADLLTSLAPENLQRFVSVEGRLARLKGVKAVYGPGTFVNQTIVQTERVLRNDIGDVADRADAAAESVGKQAIREGKPLTEATRLGEAAREKILGDKVTEYRDLMVRFGAAGTPALSNQNFVDQLVLGSSSTPKKRFQWLFPTREHALILVRTHSGLGEGQTLALGGKIRALMGRSGIDPAQISVGGVPLVGAALEKQTRSEVLRIAPVALVTMLVLLLVALRRRRGWFVPLVLASSATLIALGLSWPLGLGLSIATVAAMPVVLGLGLDFAIQVQARYWIERRAGVTPQAAAQATRAGVGPTLLLAAGAMGAGFLALTVGSVPLLDRLGLFLAIGVVAAVALALLVAPALLVWLDRGEVRPLGLGVAPKLAGLHLRPVALTCLAAVAVAGIATSGQVGVQSDVANLAPKGMGELKAVQGLQRSLGTSGQVSVAIQAKDVTDPAIVTWIGRVERDVLKHEPALKPGPSIADLVTGGDPGATVTRSDVDGVFKLLPQYFRDAVVSRDGKVAQLSFGVPFVSAAEQASIVRRIETELADPPPGVQVATAGVLAAAAHSATALDDSRPWTLLLAALLVALVLGAAWREWTRVALVLIPALITAGVVGIVLTVLDVKVSPLGAALEPLVLAVGLEFAMLLEMRYRQARRAGASPRQSRLESMREIGGAVALSAATVAAGFAVLLTSSLSLLSQLGGLVALELGLTLVASIVLVPMLAERIDTGFLDDLPQASGLLRRRGFQRGD